MTWGTMDIRYEQKWDKNERQKCGERLLFNFLETCGTGIAIPAFLAVWASLAAVATLPFSLMEFRKKGHPAGVPGRNPDFPLSPKEKSGWYPHFSAIFQAAYCYSSSMISPLSVSLISRVAPPFLPSTS